MEILLISVNRAKNTHSEGCGTDVGGEKLFEGSTGAEFLGGCDLPKPNGWVGGYPPVNPTVFAFAAVLVFVIYLH